MQSVFDNGGIIGQTMDFASTEQYVVDTYTGIVGYEDITVVGSVTGINGGTINLPAGTMQGDVVVVFHGSEVVPPSVPLNGYTEIIRYTTANPRMIIAYKVMSSTPDTTVSTSTNTSDLMTIVVVFRGVSVPYVTDGVASYTGTNVLTPNPITTTEPKSMVLIVPESGGSPGTITSYSTGFTEITQRTLSDTYDGMMGVAYKIQDTPGTVTPSACGFSTTASTERCWTLALKAKAIIGPVNTYGNYKNSGIWKLSSVIDSASIISSNIAQFISYSSVFVNSPNFTIDKPSSVSENDFLLFTGVAQTASDNVWSTPTGFTEVLDLVGRLVSYKTATASEPNTYSITDPTTSLSNNVDCALLCFRNASLDTVGVLGDAGMGTAIAPSITVSEDNSILLAIFTHNSTDDDILSVPQGFTTIYKRAAGDRPMVAIFYKFVNAGATGDVITENNVTYVGARGMLISIKTQ
jgi:hypothetical protein